VNAEDSTDSAEEDVGTYVAVVNDKEQYSIWRGDRPLPPGWRDVGKHGTRNECLEHIAEVWVDMRPARSRRAAE
jgi:MbtH protein